MNVFWHLFYVLEYEIFKIYPIDVYETVRQYKIEFNISRSDVIQPYFVNVE